MGLGILLRPELPVAARLIGATTLLLGLMGMVSVGKAVFVDKLAITAPASAATPGCRSEC